MLYARHCGLAIQRVYQKIDVPDSQNERLCQLINIDESVGDDAVLKNELYNPAGYIDGFKINVNGANGYIDILISEDHCL